VPRAGLTRDRVLAEAEAVVDEDGLPALTLAAIAARVDVRLPSLYKHVEGLDAVRHGVAERAVRELADVIRTAVDGREGADAVRSLARAYRGWARAHPGRYAATVSAPKSRAHEVADAAQEAVQPVFAALRSLGVDEPGLVNATRMLRALLHGFVALEAAGGFGLPQDVDVSFDAAIDHYIASVAG